MNLWSIMLCTAITACAAVDSGGETVLHVSPDGRDDNPGSRDEPLASLAGARDRVREVRAESPVTVDFAAGTYWFDEPVSFEKLDSGTESAAVVYRAAPGAEVRFSGGLPVTGWQAVTDPAVLPRLAEEARERVRVADLRAIGITDYGHLAIRGFNKGSQPAEAELFWEDEPMTLARWPNEGFRGLTGQEGVEKVIVDTDRLTRWVEESDPWSFAYWYHDWAELIEPIVGIDAANRMLIRSTESEAHAGISPGRARWYAFNLLSEIDTPGEYYLDRNNGRLYFWPPEEEGRAILSQSEGFVRAEDLSHVTFRGFTFEACRATAVQLARGTACRLVGCTIRNTGHAAVRVDGGVDHEVYGCDIYHCGEGGIFMSGGDRPSLTPAGHNAENNHIHHFSRRVRTYRPAVGLSGVGCRLAHSLIHDGPHMALAAGGNDHVIEYNEIHNVVYESGDAGAFYVGRDWTHRGTVLRYNYWHQISGVGGLGGMTIYLDDQQSGHVIHGNLFERCSQAVFIGGGDDNIVTNNVFIDCWRAAHLDNRGMHWMKAFADDSNSSIRVGLRAMPYTGDLWRARYPTLAGILDDDLGVPKRNVFRRNISAGGRWDDIDGVTRHLQTVEDNLVFDEEPEWIQLVKDDDGRPMRLEFGDPEAVAGIGFEPLPLTQMGLYEDDRRASWPVHHEPRPVELPEAKPQANLPPNPTYTASRSALPVTIDGNLTPEEWDGLVEESAMVLTADYEGALVTPPATAWVTHDGEALRVGVTIPLSESRDLGTAWGGSEAVELAFLHPGEPVAETLVLRGFSEGTWEATDEPGTSPEARAKLSRKVRYATTVEEHRWSVEWLIPLENLHAAAGDRLRFNVTVRRSATSSWLMWRPTYGNSFTVVNVGSLALAP